MGLQKSRLTTDSYCTYLSEYAQYPQYATRTYPSLGKLFKHHSYASDSDGVAPLATNRPSCILITRRANDITRGS